MNYAEKLPWHKHDKLAKKESRRTTEEKKKSSIKDMEVEMGRGFGGASLVSQTRVEGLHLVERGRVLQEGRWGLGRAKGAATLRLHRCGFPHCSQPGSVPATAKWGWVVVRGAGVRQAHAFTGMFALNT